jgi:hypothetical protein
MLCSHFRGVLDPSLARMGDDEMRVWIEGARARGNVEEAVKIVTSSLARWKRSTRFITYDESFRFAQEIGAVIDILEGDILPIDPEKAFKLVVRILDSEQSLIGAIDDSGGAIGDEMRRVPVLRLKAASKMSAPREGWIPQVEEIADNDDWSVRDGMLAEAGILLSEDMLLELFARYKCRALRAGNSATAKAGDFERLSFTVRMGQLAIAMKKPELYEESVRLLSPEPNGYQLLAIAEEYLRFNQPERALEFLRNDYVDWSLKKTLREPSRHRCEVRGEKPVGRAGSYIQKAAIRY